jgi:hypothetical protein
MKKLIPFILLALMFTAGCDLAGISITTTPVISSFSASPSSIAAGASSDLSWSVIGATTVSIDQGIGNVALAGSRAVVPGATTVYTLTATSGSGVSVTATTQVVVSGTVTPPPTPTPTPGTVPVIYYFTASPSNISAGASSSLSWSVSNATSLNIDHGIGTVGSSGSTLVYPATNTNYTLTAYNAAGASHQSTTIFVVSAVPTFNVTSVYTTAEPPSFTGTCPTTVNFYADITVNGPGTVTYKWESSNSAGEPIQSIYFSGAGSQIVSSWWQVDTSGSYWVRVHVYTPNETTSNQASFTVSCASSPTGGWAGTWETTYGTMILSQSGNQVSGTYEHSNGTIVGTVSGNVLTGTWAEAPSYMPPDDAGDVQLTISPDGHTFTGGWRYGSFGSWNMNWNGTTIF